MHKTKAGLSWALMVCMLLLGVVPAAAQAGLEGDPGGEFGGYVGGYDDYQDPSYPSEGCHHGCGEASGAERAFGRVATTSGGRYEYVVIGPRGQSGAARQAIEAAGGSVLRSADLEGLNQSTQVALFPSRAAFERAQAVLAQNAPGASLSAHHLYGFAQSRRAPRLYAPALIGEVEPGRCRVSRSLTIGMIDGPINTDHPALAGADVIFESIAPGHRFPSSDHGTAVAALLVGQDGEGVLSGFAQGARLHAISVFVDRNEAEEASVERIAEALDRLVRAGVNLVNLSISGPENAALGRALAAAAGQGVVLVAASGNDRRPQVSWPAASPDVIAVTAIDAARRRFWMANTGAEIEFAAPGVDVYAAQERGAGYVSGTSFSTPIVTALAARHMARGARSADAVRARLRAAVETLGPGSRNTEFGWGLVKAAGC